MTIVFFGSSEFSIEALKACSEHGRVVLAVTTPDKKRGRGLKLSPTVVKTFCLKQNIPVESPERLKQPDLIEQIKELRPELFVVSSYGKFVPSSWLEIPSKIALNVHPSLLPKYRGASPINWPILNGDVETGVSIAEVTDKLDSGDIFAQERVVLPQGIRAGELSDRLAELSHRVLSRVLKQVDEGTLSRTVQDEAQASYAGKLTKEDGVLNLEDSAVVLDRKIRGLMPWPGSFIFFEKTAVIILDAEPLSERASKKPGTLLAVERNGAITVATGDGILKIKQVKPSGKKAMSAADFIRGRRLQPGFVFPTS